VIVVPTLVQSMAMIEEKASSALDNPPARRGYADAARRRRLRRLDALLGELETLNLAGTTTVPAGLSERLRAAGVGHPTGADISYVIDLLFRAQERYLQPTPTPRAGRRTAA
jgi:hypothetical protein